MTVDQMRMMADHRQMMADRTKDGRMTPQQMTLKGSSPETRMVTVPSMGEAVLRSTLATHRGRPVRPAAGEGVVNRRGADGE